MQAAPKSLELDNAEKKGAQRGYEQEGAYGRDTSRMIDNQAPGGEMTLKDRAPSSAEGDIGVMSGAKPATTDHPRGDVPTRTGSILHIGA
ncbi:hypothetical protein [Methylorubrum aminovorans]